MPDYNFESFQDDESRASCETQTNMSLAVKEHLLIWQRDDKSCQRIIAIIKIAKLFSFNNFPYEKHFLWVFFLNESNS